MAGVLMSSDIVPMNEPKGLTGRRADKTPGNLQVKACLHQLDPRTEPQQRNCFSCWEAYFSMQPGITNASRSIVKVFGESGLAQSKGPKYAKHFVKFLASLPSQKAETPSNTTELSSTTAPSEAPAVSA
jgi:hypothetical protein